MDTENTYQGITHDFGLLLNEMYMEIKLFFFFQCGWLTRPLNFSQSYFLPCGILNKQEDSGWDVGKTAVLEQELPAPGTAGFRDN